MFALKTIVNIVFLLFFAIFNTLGQTTNEKVYDHLNDTLLIINKKIIDQEKIMLTREELFNSDTIMVNQKGLVVSQFDFYGITLGKSVTLTSYSPILTSEMKNQIINKDTNYKIIYLKDIILSAKDGRRLKPSIQSIKIIFSN